MADLKPEGMRKFLDKFLRALREQRIVPDVEGWVVKREVGLARGLHYHLFVALDGHKHRDAANITRLIGEFWQRSCVDDGCGSYFNCYVRKDSYKFNGLGLVRYGDREKMIGIREALRYMTKEDTQLKTGPGERNLRRGIRPRTGGRLGAPRHGDLRVVNDILKNADRHTLPCDLLTTDSGFAVVDQVFAALATH